jgi:hypothetical protein
MSVSKGRGAVDLGIDADVDIQSREQELAKWEEKAKESQLKVPLLVLSWWGMCTHLSCSKRLRHCARRTSSELGGQPSWSVYVPYSIINWAM